MQNTIVEQNSPPINLKPRASLAWVGKGFLILIAILTVYMVGMNLFKNPTLFANIILSGLQMGFVYALIALGYTMVYGIVKLTILHTAIVLWSALFVSYISIPFNFHMWPQSVFPTMPQYGAIMEQSVYHHYDDYLHFISHNN